MINDSPINPVRSGCAKKDGHGIVLIIVIFFTGDSDDFKAAI
jgi:hypothetical protein